MILFLPYQVDVPMERVPIANWALIAVTCVVSIAIWLDIARDRGRKEMTRQQDIASDQKDQHQPPGYGPDQRRPGYGMQPRPGGPIRPMPQYRPVPQETPPGNGSDLEAQDSEDVEEPPSWALNPDNFSVWQLFTCQFVHGGILHLVGNMMFLFVFGNAVNAKLGHLPFLVFYLLLGALAGLGWMFFGNGMPAVGASGAIMGLVGIFLVFFPRNDVSTFYFFFRYGGSFDLSSAWLILFYMSGDLISTLLGAGGGVAYVAHLVGAAFGIGVAILLLVIRAVVPDRDEENLLQLVGYYPKWPREGDDLPIAASPRKSKRRAKIKRPQE